MAEINKDTIRKAYEAGEGSFQHLADKYNVKVGTIKSWAKRDKDEGNQWKKVATITKNQKKKVATDKNEISWIGIENEYVTDIRKKPCSLNLLSKKYGISIQSLKDYSAAHEWSKKRAEYKQITNQKVREKSAELISMDAAKSIAKHFKISDIMLKEIEKAIEHPDELYKIVEKLRTGYGPGEFSEEIVTETMDAINDTKVLNLVNALEKLQKMQRETLGILNEKDKQQLDMAKQKLEIEKTKANGDLDGDIEYVVEEDDTDEED